MAQDFKPTRSELLEVRRRIRFARQGYKVLKMKRDGLIMEFFKVLEEARTIRQELIERYGQARHAMSIAEALDGKIVLTASAFGRKTDLGIQLSNRRVMGVVVPSVKSKRVRTEIGERGVGLVKPSVILDTVTDIYETLVEKILRAAEVETTLKRLIDEVEKTKRRVNALEFRVIPELEEAQTFISLHLEELERENTFRLKRVKKRKERIAAAQQDTHTDSTP